MRRIKIFYKDFRLETQTVAPTLPGFQELKRCLKYLYMNPHKPIFYPFNYYDGSNVIRLTWSGNQCEDYTTHNFLECVVGRIMRRVVKLAERKSNFA